MRRNVTRVTPLSCYLSRCASLRACCRVAAMPPVGSPHLPAHARLSQVGALRYHIANAAGRNVGRGQYRRGLCEAGDARVRAICRHRGRFPRGTFVLRIAGPGSRHPAGGAVCRIRARPGRSREDDDGVVSLAAFVVQPSTRLTAQPSISFRSARSRAWGPRHRPVGALRFSAPCRAASPATAPATPACARSRTARETWRPAASSPRR